MKRLTLSFASLFPFLVAAGGCAGPPPRVEGVLPNDCSDGADNDADGLYDCDDPSCAGAPACEEIVDSEVVFEARDHVCAEREVAHCETDTPLREERERLVVDGDRPGEVPSRVFVISELQIPSNGDEFAYGLNLDRLHSGHGSGDESSHCDVFAPDFVSANEPGHVGVDNAFGSLIRQFDTLIANQSPLCEERGIIVGCNDLMIQQSILSGDLLMAIELGDYDAPYDSLVQFTLHDAETASGGLPNFGGIEPLALRSAALTHGRTGGDVFDSRARFSLSRIDLVVMPGMNITLHDPEVRFDIEDEGLSNGVIAGTILVDELVEASLLLDGGIDEATLRAIFQMVADIEPSSADPRVCDGISAAFAFEAVPATLR